MVKKTVLLLIVLYLRLNAQSLEVFATTDTTDYLVGDYIKYRIELTYDEGIRIDSIFVKDSVKVLDFISEKPVQRVSRGDKIYEARDYIFSMYDSSTVTIPEIPIKFYLKGEKEPSVLYTNEVTINVRTLPVDPNADIRDVKAPLKIQLDWLFIAIIVLIVIIIAFITYYLYKKYRAKQNGEEKIIKRIVVPPHKEALNKLYDLKERKLWQRGMVKEYHSEITGIMREYFEKRFRFNALEMTTSEIVAELRKINEAGIVLDTVRSFLDNADLVKFAKFEPMPSVNEEMMEQAIDVVRKTAPKEESEKLAEEKANDQ